MKQSLHCIPLPVRLLQSAVEGELSPTEFLVWAFGLVDTGKTIEAIFEVPLAIPSICPSCERSRGGSHDSA